MKKSVKIISTLLMVVMLICTITTTCFADTMVGNVNIPAGNAGETKDLAEKAANIVATLRNIAAIVAVVIIAILGIKYMLGSVEEKAEYKKSFMPLIVGVVVVTLALQIAAMIFSLT